MADDVANENNYEKFHFDAPFLIRILMHALIGPYWRNRIETLFGVRHPPYCLYVYAALCNRIHHICINAMVDCCVSTELHSNCFANAKNEF